MDRFSLRDQIQLENDLNQIIETIENHREKKANEQKRIRPELTDSQKAIGMQFLTNPRLIDEIEEDYTRLGYVRERKNKILLYLVMTSRLMDTPFHTILISRSGAGKSMLVEVTEQLCPPEELHSASDLTNQALYYFGKDDLKNSFIVIGEKEGWCSPSVRSRWAVLLPVDTHRKIGHSAMPGTRVVRSNTKYFPGSFSERCQHDCHIWLKSK
ncbi:hypothetical protein ES708_21360 [subsurface metagenome]